MTSPLHLHHRSRTASVLSRVFESFAKGSSCYQLPSDSSGALRTRSILTIRYSTPRTSRAQLSRWFCNDVLKGHVFGLQTESDTSKQSQPENTVSGYGSGSMAYGFSADFGERQALHHTLESWLATSPLCSRGRPTA